MLENKLIYITLEGDNLPAQVGAAVVVALVYLLYKGLTKKK